MLFLEMKRRLYTRYFLFSILGVLIITVGLNFILTSDSKDIIHSLKQESVYEGNITEDNLLLSLKKVRDEKSKEEHYQSQVRIINTLIKTYPGLLYTEDKIQDYPDYFASEFYQHWREKFEVLIKNKLPTSEQETALDKLDDIKTPFVQYPGYYLYTYALNNLQVIFVIILFLITFLAAGTYSDSFEDDSMEIIEATKGYKRNMFIRILPVITYGVIMTAIATSATVGMISSVVGLKVLKSSLKMISIFSFGNLSIGQSILMMTITEMIGITALSTLMGYISFKTKETTKSIALGVSLSIIYVIGSKIVSSSTSTIKSLFNLIPMASSHIYYSMVDISFYFGTWEPYMIIVGTLTTFTLSTIALTITINKKTI